MMIRSSSRYLKRVKISTSWSALWTKIARHRFYIASAYLSGGRVLHVHHKVYLPTYALFDEGRFFAHGDSIRAFDTRFGRMGMLICEDFWHASPPYLLWLDGADILIFSSASPGRGLNEHDKLKSAWWVENVNQSYANLFTSFVVHSNRVGYEVVGHDRGHRACGCRA